MEETFETGIGKEEDNMKTWSLFWKFEFYTHKKLLIISIQKTPEFFAYKFQLKHLLSRSSTIK